MKFQWRRQKKTITDHLLTLELAIVEIEIELKAIRLGYNQPPSHKTYDIGDGLFESVIICGCGRKHVAIHERPVGSAAEELINSD